LNYNSYLIYSKYFNNITGVAPINYATEYHRMYIRKM